MTVMLLLGAVVAGWMVQVVLAHRQARAFHRDVAALRARGTVTVGAAGRRYRGGRVFVALAVHDGVRVVDALVLRGWTTFARARPLPAVAGQPVRRLAGDAPVAGLDDLEREACRQAVSLLRDSRAAPAA